MRRALIGAAIMASLVAGYVAYVTMIGNPRVVTDLKEHPMGERAERAMLLTFPDGKTIPVNYLREDNRVYAGADGTWWRAFDGEGAAVTLLIQGEALTGHATVELQDQEFIDDVFSRLRPTVPEWLPDWANGKLVIVDLKVSAD
ncbi:MAG TPA: hypothetical protein DCS89_03630 [Gammaproteobacteria bacterium]|nr:hypothetical protein [Gammaproteobacteria bacterium]